MGLILKYFPGLGQVVGALANPWVWVAIMAASSGSFLYATHLANQRFEAYEASVAAVGKAQKAVVRYIVQVQTVINKDTENALKQDVSRLKRDNAALLNSLQHHARRSVLPPSSPPPTGDQGRSGNSIPAGYVCFSRDKFDAGVGNSIGNLLGRSQQILERGDRGILALLRCVEWADKQHALNPEGKPISGVE